MSILKKLFGSPDTASQVTFKREVRKPHPMIQSMEIETVTRIYSAQSREAAVAFLHKQKISEPFFYIEVVTPAGVFGTDNTGEIYDSGGELPGDSSNYLQ